MIIDLRTIEYVHSNGNAIQAIVRNGQRLWTSSSIVPIEIPDEAIPTGSPNASWIVNFNNGYQIWWE